MPQDGEYWWVQEKDSFPPSVRVCWIDEGKAWQVGTEDWFYLDEFYFLEKLTPPEPKLQEN